MHRPLPGILAVALLGVCAPAALAEDDLTPLIRRAIREMGGEEALTRRLASRRTVKGHIDSSGGAKINLAITGETLYQANNGPVKMSFDLGAMGSKIRMVL